jgi:hypothetical protein
VLIRVRSTPDFAFDHDVGVPCVAGVVREASRVRSPPYCAFDHDRFALCEAADGARRSPGSTYFPDHCVAVRSAPSPGPTGTDWRRGSVGVNEKTDELRRVRVTGTDGFSVPVIRRSRRVPAVVQKNEEAA